MVMMLKKSAACCVLLVFLSAALLCTARLIPAGDDVNGNSAMKANIATSTTLTTKVKGLPAIEENMKKLNEKQVVRKHGNNNAKSASSVQRKRSVRSRLSHDVDRGYMAFTADYHRPQHHPPKNN
ncbi:hypothetical protein RIF29_16164 [Crotalaria pallida]|uniref:Uncharacterized protein n=1 Tax=Crotalaria pallida TaxID=3830 RepID=A0AAN9FEW0_CROPI